jgi:CHAT domain-containing protein/tetratricopeptide (TPR) repeat protein
MCKTTSLYFSLFVVSLALLSASGLPVGAQGVSRRSEPQAQEEASRAEALFQNALLLIDTQEGVSARLQLQEAMQLWIRIGEPGKAGKAALQVGDHYKQGRKYQDALNLYKQALKVKPLPVTVRANALNAIALIYSELYLYDLAERSFNQALEQARISNNLAAQSLALTGLAELYLKQGATEKSLECITRALRLSKQDQATADPALLYLKGRISQKQGAWADAKSTFEEALAIYRKTCDIAGQIRVLSTMSALFLLSSQKQVALEQAKQAVELADAQATRAVSQADDVNARDLRWRAWLSRARAERALGQKQSALESYPRSIHCMAGTWWQVYYIATEASAVAFREEAQAAYREYIALLMEERQFLEAYNLAEEARARTALNFTGARRVKPLSEDSEQAANLRELSQSTIQMRLQLLATDLSREQQAKLQKQIEENEYQKQEIQVQAEMAQSRARLVWTELSDADQLQKQMTEDQMTLAEFSLGEEHSYVWLFTGGEIYCETLPSRKEIEKEVGKYLNVLTATPNHLRLETDLAKLRLQAEALFAMLFDKLTKYIKQGQRLVVVPDGLLHYLPFETLIHNGHYLIEAHEISYSPSASMLGLLRDSEGRLESGDKMELLAFGNVIFDAKAKTTGGKEAANGLSKRARQMLAARGLRLAPLPRTRDEILDIANLFPADRRKVLMEKESTEEAVKREPLRRYRRLHFATHSLIDEKFPLRSAVVLTPGDDAQEDGLLEVSEIARLDLECDLVVVSACQTGRGQLLSGEGIIGLSRAFLYAGARSVVVSLWNVSDVSTGQLMKTFYQNLTAGQSNAAALRKAKLKMLGSGNQTRHPYYWSSFVMVGKP